MKLSEQILEDYEECKELYLKYRLSFRNADKEDERLLIYIDGEAKKNEDFMMRLTQAYKDALFMEGEIQGASNTYEKYGSVTTSTSMLTTEEASKYLGVSLSTMYKYTHKNTIPFSKPTGRKNYFKKVDLDLFLESTL